LKRKTVGSGAGFQALRKDRRNRQSSINNRQSREYAGVIPNQSIKALKGKKRFQSKNSTWRVWRIKAIDKAIEIARQADAQKAEEVLVLDVRGLANFTDFFVICNGHTRNHLRAIGQASQRELRRRKTRCFSTSGYGDSDWVVLDYEDVIVHAMLPATRAYYGIEHLWGDGKRVDWTPTG
jgi:ribosome-associated protein